MRTIQHIAVLAALILETASTHAQYVKGNEAVTRAPNGTIQVQTPPLPKMRLSAPCPAEGPLCTAVGWRMVETKDGLRECTEFYARPSTCRASTFGVEKRPRQWIVKSKGQWLQCERPVIDSRCVSTKALPNVSIQ